MSRSTARRSRRPRVAAFAIAALTAAGLFGGLAVPASAATAAPAASAAPAAASAAPVTLGVHDSAINKCISDENSARKSTAGWSTTLNVTLTGAAKKAARNSFNTGSWKSLGVSTARYLVPWDIAYHHAPSAADNHDLLLKEECLDQWLIGARNHKVSPEIDLDADLSYKPNGKIVAPAVGTYTAAAKAFITKYSDAGNLHGRARVRIIASWNEPDLLAKPSRRVYVPGGGRPMADPCRNEARTCGPVLAARMWQAVQANCKQCSTVIAGDFSSLGGIRGREKGYLGDYRRALGKSPAKVWALHPYSDIMKFESKWHEVKKNKKYVCVQKKGQPNLSKSLVGEFANDLKNSSATQIWLTEVSAFQYRTQSGKNRPCWTPAVQARAASYALSTLPRAASKPGDPPVTREYYFNFRSLNNTNNRWSLILDNGKVQPVLRTLAKH